ncbi:MAG: hypothetical protein HBSAPP03_27460 [Phycisphaerae bacterium]|nr:MAG: hypothetical protein HBSAPP03_27460 [Phycisphaerae bacterium]
MSLSALETRLRDLIAARRDSMLADLTALVRIPTGYNHAPGLDETRGILTARLAALGASLDLIPGDPKPDWIDPDAFATGSPPSTAVARRPRGEGPRVLLGGHLDTVHDPRGAFDRLTLGDNGEIARGPGAADMKGGLLIAIVALEAIDEAGVPLSWGFFLNSDEETGSYHSDAALRRIAKEYDAGLIFEPALPDGSLVVERPGSGQFQVRTTGVPAHVGRDFRKGVSAIVGMADCIKSISDMADPDRGLIASVGVVRGGKATNIVPDECTAWGNVRFRDPAIASEIATRFDDLARPHAVAGVHVRYSFNRPAKPLIPGTRALATLAQAAAADLGQPLPFGVTGGVCDGNNLQSVGLPTIDTLGVRGGGLHTIEEWVEVASLVERAQLTAVLLARLAEGRLQT